MPYSGESGKYGGIPYSELRDKYEVTRMRGNAKTDLNDHMRESLRDMSCSATFFESDHKRDDNHSETYLNLRHTGHRTGETPDAPDLFLELTDREPRGTALAPDLHKLRDISWARRDLHKFRNDEAYTTTEREKMPHVIQQQLRDQMEMARTRLKIFSTSRDSQSTNLGQKRIGDRAEVEDQTAIGSREEIVAAIKRHGQQQDQMALGWEQTGDQDIRVATLAQHRRHATSADPHAAQSQVAASQRVADSVAQTVATGTANIMAIIVDRMREGRSNNAAMDQDQRDAQGVLAKTMQFFTPKRSRVEDAALMSANVSDATVTAERFIGQLNRQSGMQGQDVETQLQIVQFMDNAIVASKAGDAARFCAEDIVLTAKLGVSEEFAPRQIAGAVDPLTRRDVDSDRVYSSSATVAQLGARRHDGERNKTLVGEGYKTSSRERMTLRGRQPAAADDLSRTKDRGAQHHQTFSTSDRAVRGLGTKFTRDRVDTDRTVNAISRDN